MFQAAETVTVIIVNYKSADYLKSCLHSLKSGLITKIIVLDNGSGADEWHKLQMMADLALPRVQLVQSEVNIGFGAGVNMAAMCIANDYEGLIWILNPDTLVEEGCVEVLANVVRSGEWDIVSPAIMSGPRASSNIWFVGGGFDHTKGSTFHTEYGQRLEDSSGIRSTEFMTGAAPMMSFATWDSLGGFDERLFLYWEDAEFSLRAQASGKQMGVSMDARIWHEEGGSGEGKGRSATYYFYMQRNRLIVESRFTSRWNLTVGRGALETLRLLLRPLREKERRLAKLGSSFRGLLAGLRAGPLSLSGGSTGPTGVNRLPNRLSR